MTDLGSTNGTFVNGTRLSGSIVLRGGEEIRLGSHVLRPEAPVGMGPGTVIDTGAVAAAAPAGPPPTAAVPRSPAAGVLPPTPPPGLGLGAPAPGYTPAAPSGPTAPNWPRSAAGPPLAQRALPGGGRGGSRGAARGAGTRRGPASGWRRLEHGGDRRPGPPVHVPHHHRGRGRRHRHGHRLGARRRGGLDRHELSRGQRRHVLHGGHRPRGPRSEAGRRGAVRGPRRTRGRGHRRAGRLRVGRPGRPARRRRCGRGGVPGQRLGQADPAAHHRGHLRGPHHVRRGRRSTCPSTAT